MKGLGVKPRSCTRCLVLRLVTIEQNMIHEGGDWRPSRLLQIVRQAKDSVSVIEKSSISHDEQYG